MKIHFQFCVSVLMRVWELSRTYEETKNVFIRKTKSFTLFLQEVLGVAKCSLLFWTIIDTTQRKTKYKYLQLLMCWISHLPAKEKQTLDLKESKAIFQSACRWNFKLYYLVHIHSGSLENLFLSNWTLRNFILLLFLCGLLSLMIKFIFEKFLLYNGRAIYLFYSSTCVVWG